MIRWLLSLLRRAPRPLPRVHLHDLRHGAWAPLRTREPGALHPPRDLLALVDCAGGHRFAVAQRDVLPDGHVARAVACPSCGWRLGGAQLADWPGAAA